MIHSKMITKRCFKCNMVKPLDEFYRHPKMGDGHLGKCKDCSKKYIKDYTKEKQSTDLEWTLKERERMRLKAQRVRKEGRQSKKKKETLILWQARNPEKKKAHTMVHNAIRDGKLIPQPCFCGEKAQAHHDDYSKPLDVRWLCVKHHNEHHYNERTKMLVEKLSQHVNSKPI